MNTATKLNPYELLSKLALSSVSGCLVLEDGLVSWKIYLNEGQLSYVSCSAQLLEQLAYYLHYLGLREVVAALKKLPPSYLKIQSHSTEQPGDHNFYSQIIIWLLTEKYLSESQGLKLLEMIVKDSLESCLWLNKGTSTWLDQETLPDWIQNRLGQSLLLNFSACLENLKIRVSGWRKCSPALLSSHQRPYFTSGWENKSLPSSGALDKKTLQELAQVIRGRTSLRQLSIVLKKDELQVAQVLSPYINNKIIYLRNAQPPLDKLPSILHYSGADTIEKVDSSFGKNTSSTSTTKCWKIVCIDDSPTILSEMQRFLGQEKFDVTAIEDPVKAVSIIFKIKPDLILLDITMPKINGYKLCGLLRSSAQCTTTPIIMVTGNTSFIDKARAKLAGATDYFTKPFTQKGLMQIVEKYLNQL